MSNPTILAHLSILLALTVACKSPPREPNPNARAHTTHVLASYTDREQLSQFVGVVPSSCLPSTPTTELCEWHASGRAAGWRAMANAIGSGDRLNLICELSISGEPRAAGSCSIHPRRSNRYSWKLPSTAGTRNTRSAVGEREKVRERHRNTVNQWMAEAKTLPQLSRLMGAIPDECARSSDREQYCTWRTTGHTFGQGTLVVWIDARKGKKIRLHCALPSDGSPRASDSCYAEVGG